MMMKINEFGQFRKYVSIQFEFFQQNFRVGRDQNVRGCVQRRRWHIRVDETIKKASERALTGSSFRLCIHLFTESNLLN